MKILAAIRREKKKIRKQLAKLQNQLSGLEAACESVGRFHEQGNQGREEARAVGCRSSCDC